MATTRARKTAAARTRPAAPATAPAAPSASAAPAKPKGALAKPAASAKPAKPASSTRPAKAASSTKPAKAAASAKPAKAGRADKPEKTPKLRTKPVRDSFTMPEADFALIGTLKARSLAAGRETKKSELLRAGLQALAALDTAALVAALGRLEPVKIGRPKKGGGQGG